MKEIEETLACTLQVNLAPVHDMYPFSWTHIIYKPKHMDASLYFTGGIHFVFF